MTAAPDSLLRQWTGPFTHELVQVPGAFGLGNVPARLKPDATTTTVCGFCSTGCGLNIHLKDGEAINLSAATDYPVNLGMACPKGWEALTPLAAPDRGTTPLLRNERGEPSPVDWSTAMNEFCARFKAIQARHGPHSIAFLSTGQFCTEEMALLGALFKFGMGALHCDSNTRQCMATSHVAYKQSFGFDAPPFTYADFEESDVLVFIGSNLCIAHPILWQRVLRNRHRPEIIVIDPRRTETAMNATQHLALRPKADLTLLYGLANLLLQNGWIDRAFIERSTTGFAEFAGFVRRYTPDRVAAETGLTIGQLLCCAETIHRGKAVSFWWTMGVNQSHEATRTAQAIINLALMTGNLGRPGTGANSITGQCNAMGSRLFANVTSLLGGHDFADPAHRAKVAGILGIDENRIPTQPSRAYDQIIDGIDRGEIKGLWVIATNPAHSWIGRGGAGDSLKRSSDQPLKRSSVEALKRAEGAAAGPASTLQPLNASTPFDTLLSKLDFLVVQDMYATTETARHAHLFLPAAGWGEKEGTLINSERRLGLVKMVARPPGQALSDFNIFRLVANAWGCGDMFARWTSPEAAFQIMKELSRGQPCDLTGIEDYAHLDREGGIQWPFPETRNAECGMWNEDGAAATADSAFRIPHSALTGRRLFADGRFFTPDGRARFIFDPPRPAPEQPDADYPFVLLTGRGTSAQWHTNTRTGKSAILRQLYPQNCYVEIHPADAHRLGIAPNATVRVASRRGSITATAFVAGTVQPGQVFVPMHYADVNLLTCPVFDPHSRQPSYKHCAVRVEAVVEG